ncbi:MAG: AarF/UbiB family protein [Candidatus Limnocylindrales bacterium]
MLTRFRQTGWVIALWALVLLIFAVASYPEAAGQCVDPTVCSNEVVAVVLAMVFGVAFLFGAIVLLLTHPDGLLRSVLVQMLVNVIALMVSLALLSVLRLPGVDAEGSHHDVPLLSIPDLLVAGLLFAVVNGTARPVLFALFGRLILRSLGLAVVLLNAVLFWIVFQVSDLMGNPWVLPDPRLLWLFIDSIVFTAVLTILSTFLGLDRPHLDEAGNDRVWRLLERLPARRRNAIVESIRLQEVYDTVSSFGLEIATGGSMLAPVRRMGDRLMGRSVAGLEKLSTPAKVRVMLQQLGPTFVKLGQMISSRADALPEDWRTELDKLQSTVPPFPWERAKAILTAELGADPETLYASIEHEPFAAASLAQVHRATLHDGREVVVKVQRPDVQAKVRADLGVIQELAGVAEARFPVARQLDAQGLAKEFADGVAEELDYRSEAYHARRLADVIRSIPGTAVPEVHGELSTSRVLTMDFIPGVKATKADQLDPTIDREQVARTFMRAVIKQIMLDGFFHADPHPGNILVDPHTGVITFLDLGLIGEIRQEQRLDLLALLWALRMSDPGALATVSLRLCVATGDLDEDAYRTDVERLSYQYWIYGDASFTGMVGALFATLRDHGLRMRRELTLAVKAITQAEELLRALYPGMSLVDTATQEAEALIRSELTPERAARIARGQLAAVVQSFLGTANDRRGDLGPLLLQAITGGRLGPERTDGIDLTPLVERIDAVGERMDVLGRRLALATGGAGVAIGLSIALAAVIGDPGVQTDGTVLVVGVVTGGVLGFLAYRTLLGRG